LPGAEIKIPYKKPKGGTLTSEQKEENKIQSSQRIPVEYGYAGIKHHARLRGPYNGTADQLDAEFAIAAAVYNRNRLWDDRLKKIILDDTRVAHVTPSNAVANSVPEKAALDDTRAAKIPKT